MRYREDAAHAEADAREEANMMADCVGKQSQQIALLIGYVANTLAQRALDDPRFLDSEVNPHQVEFLLTTKNKFRVALPLVSIHLRGLLSNCDIEKALFSGDLGYPRHLGPKTCMRLGEEVTVYQDGKMAVLSPDVAKDLLAEFLDDEVDCHLPCFTLASVNEISQADVDEWRDQKLRKGYTVIDFDMLSDKDLEVIRAQIENPDCQWFTPVVNWFVYRLTDQNRKIERIVECKGLKVRVYDSVNGQFGKKLSEKSLARNNNSIKKYNKYLRNEEFN
tara:strand:- start:126 stop:956 length:831 start_codon:yes stop_codon:yes gene_type:complete